MSSAAQQNAGCSETAKLVFRDTSPTSYSLFISFGLIEIFAETLSPLFSLNLPRSDPTQKVSWSDYKKSLSILGT